MSTFVIIAEHHAKHAREVSVGWKNEILQLFNIIPAPTEVYEDLNRSPRSRIPLIFLVISSAVIGWFMIPAMIEPMRKIFESSFGGGGARAAVNGITKSMIVAQLVIAPGVTVLRWFVLAGIFLLLAVIVAGNDGHSFKRLFSAVAYTESIFIFMNLLTLLIINLRGLDRLESAHDLTIFKGLEVLLKDENSSPILWSLLSALNPFTTWYILTLSVGFHVMIKTGKVKSIGIVSIGWLCWVLLSEIQGIVARLLVQTTG